MNRHFKIQQVETFYGFIFHSKMVEINLVIALLLSSKGVIICKKSVKQKICYSSNR